MAVPTKKCKPEYDKIAKKKKYYFHVQFCLDELKELLMKELVNSSEIEPIVDKIIATYQDAPGYQSETLMKLLYNRHLSEQTKSATLMGECVDLQEKENALDAVEIAKLSDEYLKCRLKRYKNELENLRKLPITTDTSTYVSNEMNKHKEYIKLLEIENTRRKF